MLTDESISPTALATALEERSFDAMFVGEHSHIPTSRETPFPFGGDLPREFHRELDAFAARAGRALDPRRGRVVLHLPTLPASEALTALDAMVETAKRYR